MIFSIFRLVRLPNLIIVAATQCLMRYFVIEPFLKVNHFNLQLPPFQFFLLVLSTVLIAAAGYAINDYFDTHTDRLNRPDKVVIDKKISRHFAINLHVILTLLGTGTGIYLSFYIKVPGMSVLFLLAGGLLWFYSTNFKKNLLIGNLLVSFLTAVVPLMVILFELPLLNRTYGSVMMEAGQNFNYIFFWVGAFSFFAFFTNLIREIVKDSEDYLGDKMSGMRTLPIQLGIPLTKVVVVILITLLIGLLSFLMFKFVLLSGVDFDYLSAFYLILTVIFPLFLMIFQIIIAKTKRDYHISSQILKIVMLFGVLYSFIVFYKLTFRLG